MRVLVLALVLVAGLVAVAAAQDAAAPKLGMLDYSKRLSIAAVGRYDYEYASQSADPTTIPGKEFVVGLESQYLLSPMMTLTVGSVYHVDTKQIRSFLGLSVPFYGAARPQALAPPPSQ